MATGAPFGVRLAELRQEDGGGAGRQGELRQGEAVHVVERRGDQEDLLAQGCAGQPLARTDDWIPSR